MSVDIGTFTGNITLNAAIHKRYSGRAADLGAIATALGSDTTTHDRTIESAPAALRIGAGNTPFTNDILLNINEGKAGNLTVAAMATAITALAGALP